MDNFKSIADVVDKNLPHVLTGLGVAGVVATGVSAAIAAPKAKAKVEELEDPTMWEAICVAAPYYVPTILIGGASIACIIGADRVSTGRYLALASSYAVLQKKVDPETKNSLKKAIGLKTEELPDKKDEKTSDSEKHTDEMVVRRDDVVKCRDKVTGVTFNATSAKIREAEAKTNAEIARLGNASVGTFYDFLDLDYKLYPDTARNIWFGHDYNVPAMEITIGGECDSDGTPYLTLKYDYDTEALK